jgi:FeS assembly SUF system regulator
MLRLSKLTDYGIVIMTCLAEEPDEVRAANEVAVCTHVALPTVSKVLKRLSRAGLVVSCRGAKGGYRLARPARSISVARVIDALEGRLALTECSSDSSTCSQESHCTIRGNWQRINGVIRDALETVSLAEMLAPPISVDVDMSGLQQPRQAQA